MGYSQIRAQRVKVAKLQLHTAPQLFHLDTQKSLSEPKAYIPPPHVKYLNLLTSIKESGFKDEVKSSPTEMLRDKQEGIEVRRVTKNTEKRSFCLI